MKRPLHIIFAILLLVPACNRNNSVGARADSEQESTARANLERQRDDYVKTVNAKLDEFDKKVDGLEERTATMKDATKQSFKNDISQLRDERKMVARKLDDLKKVSVDSWTAIKGEVDSGLTNLERSYQMVSSKYEPSSVPTSKPPAKSY
jgi:DNA repair exonuclease SbcCD ATPase subunit